jgi:hypothetical protein
MAGGDAILRGVLFFFSFFAVACGPERASAAVRLSHSEVLRPIKLENVTQQHTIASAKAWTWCSHQAPRHSGIPADAC